MRCHLSALVSLPNTSSNGTLYGISEEGDTVVVTPYVYGDPL